MKKRIILKRGIAYLLAAAMVVGLMVCTPSDMMNVQAADGESASTTTGKTVIGLGTSGIADPVTQTGDSDAWTGSYVYFGTYNGSPVKYRVLDSNTTVFGGTTMFLDCDSVLWAGSDPSSAFDTDSNVWADSDIRTYLNETFLNSTVPFISLTFLVRVPSLTLIFVFNTSFILLADTLARGTIINIIASIRNDIITCIAYDENTIISPNKTIFSLIPASFIRIAPIK